MNLFISNHWAVINILSSKSGIRFRVESWRSSNCRDEHAHWMCIVSKVLHHDIDILMDKCVCHNPDCKKKNFSSKTITNILFKSSCFWWLWKMHSPFSNNLHLPHMLTFLSRTKTVKQKAALHRWARKQLPRS